MREGREDFERDGGDLEGVRRGIDRVRRCERHREEASKDTEKR